jgi:cation diffusion facilitator CzcD-associated flavoprotein CzcO
MQQNPSAEVDAVVVGAGFSGLYMLHRLRGLGLSTRALEAASGVGGTWYWNRYPGARCDSESHYYCYSFSDEIRKEWKWSCRYPAQPEILDYLNFVADRLDLRRGITFDTRVTAGTYDERTNLWEVETDRGERIRTRYLITGVGNTSAASSPVIPGIEAFRGAVYHTAHWPHEKVDFSGKRVGLVGTGSSGIQSTPMIAAEAAHLTVFQRTPNFSVPARNHPLTDEMRRELEENFDSLRAKTLKSPIGMPFDVPQVSALDVTPEERQRKYDALWEAGGFRFMFESYNDLVLSLEANATAADYVRAKIRGIVHNPAVAEILCPTDHPIGTKRPPIDTSYYETFNRDNVTLVDIKANPIEAATPDGLRLRNGDTHALDCIVFATGFDAVTGSLIKMNLRGRGGVSLGEKWANGPLAYLGVATAGFPNLFMITGPGSPSILANFPVCIEQHVDWITDCIVRVREQNLDIIEPSVAAEQEWARMIAEEANKTLLPLANSWYMGANIPGKPRVFLAYPNGIHTYTELCAGIAERGYEGFELRSIQIPEAAE